VILALLLRDRHRDEPHSGKLAAVRRAAEHLELAGDSRHLVEFLVSDDLQMSKLASAAADARAIEGFAAYLNKASLFHSFTTEEHLKALCLLTLATIDAEGALTPARADALWQLYVATYGHLTRAYGDELIDASTLKRTTLNASRPSTVSEHDLAEFLVGLPKRYLTMFEPRSIYEHVRVCRNLSPDDVHCFLQKAGGALWELTVVTLDKPFLFSNICGVLAYLDMDILSGQAVTSRRGAVLDLFRFHDPEGLLDRSDPKALLTDVIAERIDVRSLLDGKQTVAARASATSDTPVIAVDNSASVRFTIVEIVVRDAPGVLYRISRALSTFRCEIEMVVISTEGAKAHDIFHVMKGGAKLAPEDTPALVRALEASLVEEGQGSRPGTA
jgi:[protein-PII] uridylyltransferase